MSKMMKCGHAAQAVNGKGEPVCVICVGINPGATVVDDAPPSLAGRMAECSYRRPGPYPENHRAVPSDPGLPFFEHRPDSPTDRYYCGCFGWD